MRSGGNRDEMNPVLSNCDQGAPLTLKCDSVGVRNSEVEINPSPSLRGSSYFQYYLQFRLHNFTSASVSHSLQSHGIHYLQDFFSNSITQMIVVLHHQTYLFHSAMCATHLVRNCFQAS